MEFGVAATGIGALDHLGIVVADAPQSAAAFAALTGLPSPQIRDNHGEGMRARGVRYRGAPIGGGTYAAWFSLAGAGVNLMAPNGGPSPWSDHLEALGAGPCYLAFAVSDPAATLEALDALGYPTVQTGTTGSGAPYGYGDAREALGVYLEILPGRAAPGGIATPPAQDDAPRLASIGFAAADVAAVAEGWARVLGLEPPEVRDGAGGADASRAAYGSSCARSPTAGARPRSATARSPSPIARGCPRTRGRRRRGCSACISAPNRREDDRDAVS